MGEVSGMGWPADEELFTDTNLREIWERAAILRQSLVERGLSSLISDATGEPIAIVKSTCEIAADKEPKDQPS